MKRIPRRTSFPGSGPLQAELTRRDEEIADAIQSLTPIVAETTYDPGSLAFHSSESFTITVPGARLGDFASAAFSLDLQGITLTAYVSADDTVTVRLLNESGGLVDLGSGTLRVHVFKF